MDPAIVVSMLSTAVAALFGVVIVTMRQQREDWKGLFEREVEAHKETRKEATEEVRENAKAIRTIADFIHELPKRREDWEQAGGAGRMPERPPRGRRAE